MLTAQDNELITHTNSGTPMGELFRRFWVPVMLAKEIPGADCPPVRVNVLGEALVAFRDTDGRIGLLDRACAHRRADLFFGRNEECGLRCVYHGWKYDVEGNCVDMPSEPPESSFKDEIKLSAYPCVERGGLIWAYMGPKDLKPELPNLEWARVPDDQRYVQKTIMDCNYLQTLEGDIDTVHSAFLHRWFNRSNQRRGPQGVQGASLQRANLRSKRGGEWAKFTVKDTDYGVMIGAYRDAEDEDDSYIWHISHWLMPSYALVAGGQPGQSLRCNVRIPIDDTHFMFFRVQWHPDRPFTAEELAWLKKGTTFGENIPGTFLPKRNLENDFLIDRELQKTLNYTGIRSVPEQDQAVTISMGPIVDRSKENLGTSDTAIVAMRHKLLRSVRDLLEGTEPYPAYHGDVYRVRQCDVLLKRNVPFDEGAKEVMIARA